MKIQRVLLSVICLIGIALGTTAQPFVINDTIPIKHGTSKLRLYKNVEKWFEKEKGQKLLGKNWKERKLTGKGYFPYSNHVQIPDIYLSSHAAEKTKGSIIFTIDIEIQDSIIVAKFSNFIHEARFSEYGETSYGRLMAYEKVPSGKCMEVEEWCNAVWADMKNRATKEIFTRAGRMIPSTLIRKRTFKVEEEKKIETQAAPAQDPMEYLNIDNYLLKDTEGKYADYNKDPEEIAAEKAAAAAALAEKEKKKHKDSEYDEDWEEDYEETENPSPEQSAAAPDSQPRQEESDYNEYDDEEVVVSAPKEQDKKDKSAKSPKVKKPKKSKDDDYDDFDDYDDEDY